MFPFGFWKSSFTFTNASALAYWNALTVANGGEVQGSLYGITQTQLKQAIDNFFIAGASGGWLTGMVGMYLYIGATASTHAINAINPGTFNLTFINAPTQSISGFGALNGTTQYATTGIIPNSHLSLNSVHLSFYNATNNFAVTQDAMGCVNASTPSRLRIRFNAVITKIETFLNSTNSASVSTNINDVVGFWIATRRAAADCELYKNGITDGTNNTGSGSLSTQQMTLGAFNNNGTITAYSNWLFKFHSIGAGLTDGQSVLMNTAVYNLQIALGR